MMEEFDRSTSITLFKFGKEIGKCIWRDGGELEEMGMRSMENGERRHGADGED